MNRPTLQSLKSKYNTQNSYNGKEYSPMRDLAVGQEVKFRFVPAIDSLTGMFFSERKTIPCEFTNPQDPDEVWRVFLPSKETYTAQKMLCPLANRIRFMYKEADKLKEAGNNTEEEALRSVAKAHWLKSTWYFLGFVNNANELSVISLPKSVVKVINDTVFGKTAIFDALPTGEFTADIIKRYIDDEDKVPEEFDSEEAFVKSITGHQFIVNKSTKGGFNHYEGQWDIKTHVLSKDQMVHIAGNGLVDLRTHLPEKPSDSDYEVFKSILNASIAANSGEGDSAWNSDWDSVIKPLKPRASGESDSPSSAANGASNIKPARPKKATKSTDSMDRDAIMAEIKNRGKPKNDDLNDEVPF